MITLQHDFLTFTASLSVLVDFEPRSGSDAELYWDVDFE